MRIAFHYEFTRMTLCRRDEKLEINSISIISLTPCEICACACAMKNNKISIWDVKKMCMCTKPRLKVTSFQDFFKVLENDASFI